MSQPTEGEFPLQRQPLRAVSMPERVRFVVLLQILEHETANRRRTAAICSGTDQRDFDAALVFLVGDGSLARPTSRLDTLGELAAGGFLTLTERGMLWLRGEGG